MRLADLLSSVLRNVILAMLYLKEINFHLTGRLASIRYNFQHRSLLNIRIEFAQGLFIYNRAPIIYLYQNHPVGDNSLYAYANDD